MKVTTDVVGRTGWIPIVLVLPWFLVGSIASPAAPPPEQQPNTPSLAFTFQPGNRIVLEGSSTVTDWTCNSSNAGGFVQFPVRESKYQQVYRLVKQGQIQNARETMQTSLGSRSRALVWFPIRSFQCDNQRMTRDMYQALKVKKQRIILFQYNNVDSLEFVKSAGEESVNLRLTVTGGLAIAGNAQTKQTTMTVKTSDPRTYLLEGKLTLRMSEFDIQRPTALMGLIQAYDEVTVRYRLRLKRIDNPPQQEAFVRQSLQRYLELVSLDDESPSQTDGETRPDTGAGEQSHEK